MTPLHPRHLTLLRIRSALFALVLLALLIWGDLELTRREWVPGGVTTGVGVLLLLLGIWLLPRRRYEAWAFLQGEDELTVRHGMMVRKLTVVPFGRVQHTDVTRGPLQRMLGLATLVLNTAGTLGSSVKLPGLLHADAEAMRDHVRGQIRQDLV